MKVFRIENMKGGWFLGDFVPSVYQTSGCEAACKRYRAGDYEQCHIHKIATEITLIVSGRALMNGEEYKSGDIVVLEPGEATDFRALEDTVNFVVKIPSVKGDKYTMPHSTPGP